MHTFQPYPLEVFEDNPFRLINDSYAIVTQADHHINAMTASWGTLGVLWHKNVVIVYVRESRFTRELLDKSDTFAITCMDPVEYKDALHILGTVSGRDNVNKIKEAKLHLNLCREVPFIDEGRFTLICKKLSRTPIELDQILDPQIKEAFYKDNDIHIMYVGEILEALAR